MFARCLGEIAWRRESLIDEIAVRGRTGYCRRFDVVVMGGRLEDPTSLP